VIQSISLSYSIASASVGEIENFGIVPATFLAMRRSIEKLDKSFKCLLVDGNRPLSDYSGKQMSIIKGDSICYNIASSSILAKQARDSFMNEASEKYPCYGFDTNVGYGTKKHLEALKNFGASPLHRSNFSPMREMR
jgi:ribonuclease HII